MKALGEFLFGKRRTAFRVLSLIPAFIAFVFLGHAFEDGGIAGALPYFAIVLAGITYVVRPMVMLWLPLFGLFVFYAILVATSPSSTGSSNEWIIFILIGLIPAIAMLFAWP